MSARPVAWLGSTLRPTSSHRFALAAVVAGLVLGGLVAREVPVGLGVLVAVAYGLLVLVHLPLGVAAWLLLSFFEAIPRAELGVKVAGLVLAFAWLGTLGSRPETVAALRRHAKLLASVLLLLVWIVLSLTWSDEPDIGPYFQVWVVAAVVFVVVATGVSSASHVRFVAGAFVLGTLFSLLIGIGGGETALSGALPSASAGLNPSGRVQGGLGGANFLAGAIVAGIALAGGLTMGARSKAVRVALLGAVGILVLGLIATQSRGGLVSLLAAAVAAVAVFRGRRIPVLLFVGFTLSASALSLALSPAAAERVFDEDSRGGSGRVDTWRAALAVSRDHPVIGVGVHNYHVHALRYVGDLSSVKTANLLGRKQVVHNVYLEMLVETGIVGLTLYLVVVGACLLASWRAAQRLRRLGDDALSALANSVFVATIAILSSVVFLSGGANERIWVLLALGPALLLIAERRTTPAGRRPRRPR